MTLSVLGQTGIVQGKVFFKRDLEALTGVGISFQPDLWEQHPIWKEITDLNWTQECTI